MANYPVVLLIKRLTILLLGYSVCRALFLLFNPTLVSSVSSSAVSSAFIHGLRFDIYSIIIINVLFILGHIIPNKKFYSHWFQKNLKWLFYIFNIPALLLNFIDLIYFRYTQKRTTSDLFSSAITNDLKDNFGIYIRDYWYILLLLVAMIVIMEWMYRKTTEGKAYYKNALIAWCVFIITTGLTVIGGRGGLQFKPLGMQAAARYVPQQLIPVVINTPFAIIKTLGEKSLPDAAFMSDEQARSVFHVVKSPANHGPIRKLNVVILVMESFSKEYIGYFNKGLGYTPFLDSLCKKSLVFTNAYANAKRSIEGIPAIISSLPHLMDEAFITSAYNTNAVNSLGNILSEYGYTSSFFHGGSNGTMGLENFSMLAGFNRYYGKNEYEGSDENYDGSWGIYDEPFFEYMLNEMKGFEQPFVSVFFSLSSHHPYSIPEKYNGKFPKGTLPIHESIGYADHALKKFFAAASTESWYDNTLFVLTADHTGPAEQKEYMTSQGIFEIPVIYYSPADTTLTGVDSNVTQQTDLLPSILDYLNYPRSFAAFGNSVFTGREPFAINYTNNIYQAIDNQYILMSDGEDVAPLALYDYNNDPLLTNNILNTNGIPIMLSRKTKAIVQQYRKKMTGNTLLKE